MCSSNNNEELHARNNSSINTIIVIFLFVFRKKKCRNVHEFIHSLFVPNFSWNFRCFQIVKVPHDIREHETHWGFIGLTNISTYKKRNNVCYVFFSRLKLIFHEVKKYYRNSESNFVHWYIYAYVRVYSINRFPVCIIYLFFFFINRAFLRHLSLSFFVSVKCEKTNNETSCPRKHVKNVYTQ